MIETNVSERLNSLKHEMSELGISNARYRSRKGHTALGTSANDLRHGRLLQIKEELADIGGYTERLRMDRRRAPLPDFLTDLCATLTD